MKASPEADRFWAKVDAQEAGCWRWLAAISNTGYGSFHPTPRTHVTSHRYAYEAVCGPIPDGLVIDHLCRNRACVNPAHLEVVTRTENNLRGISPPAFNAQKTLCIRGHGLERKPNGKRFCRTCYNAQQNARRAERGVA